MLTHSVCKVIKLKDMFAAEKEFMKKTFARMVVITINQNFTLV